MKRLDALYTRFTTATGTLAGAWRGVWGALVAMTEGWQRRSLAAAPQSAAVAQVLPSALGMWGFSLSYGLSASSFGNCGFGNSSHLSIVDFVIEDPIFTTSGRYKPPNGTVPT